MEKPKHNFSLRHLASKMILGQENGDKGEEYAFKKEGWSLRFHRKISKPLVLLIKPFAFITPNHITWFGFFLSVLSALTVALAGSNLIWLIIASILYWLSAILDCVDGQLARDRSVTSRKGAWLDFVLEGGKGVAFWLGVGFNLSARNSEIFGFDVWFLITIALGFLGFLSVISIYSSWMFAEDQPISHDHVYIAMIIIIFNLFEISLILFDIGIILVVIYSLFEKTFLFHPDEP